MAKVRIAIPGYRWLAGSDGPVIPKDDRREKAGGTAVANLLV